MNIKKKSPKLDFVVREPGQPRKPSFAGPYFQWIVNYNIDGYKGTSDDFVVLSSGRRHVVHRKLWLKLLYEELSFEEFLLFLSMPETLRNNKLVGLLRARLEVPKVLLRQRLLQIEKFLGEKPSLRESHLGLRRIRVDILTERRRLRKTPKFSGYIKNNAKQKGSLGGASYDAPLISDDPSCLERILLSDNDWYLMLTVGEITLLGQSVQLPEESLKIKTKQSDSN